MTIMTSEQLANGMWAGLRTAFKMGWPILALAIAAKIIILMIEKRIRDRGRR